MPSKKSVDQYQLPMVLVDRISPEWHGMNQQNRNKKQFDIIYSEKEIFACPHGIPHVYNATQVGLMTNTFQFSSL